MSKELVHLRTPKKTLVIGAVPVGVSALVGLGGAMVFATPIILILALFFGGLIGATYIDNFNLKAMRSHDIADNTDDENYVYSDGNTLTKAPETEYDCPNFAAVMFETKLLTEGVIGVTEMSLCDVEGCVLCTPLHERAFAEERAALEEERKARKAEHEKVLREAKARVEKTARERDAKQLTEMLPKDAERIRAWKEKYDDRAVFEKDIANCARCNTYTWFLECCPRCRLERLINKDELDRQAKIAAKKAEAAAKRAEKKRLFELNRHVDLDGLHLVRPLDVPEGAVPSLLHGRDIDPMATHSFIVWKWTEDGQSTKIYKQPMRIDAYSVNSAGGGVIKSWYSMTDGDGRYVGDYTTVNGKFYNAKTMEDVKASFYPANSKPDVWRD